MQTPCHFCLLCALSDTIGNFTKTDSASFMGLHLTLLFFSHPAYLLMSNTLQPLPLPLFSFGLCFRSFFTELVNSYFPKGYQERGKNFKSTNRLFQYKENVCVETKSDCGVTWRQRGTKTNRKCYNKRKLNKNSLHTFNNSDIVILKWSRMKKQSTVFFDFSLAQFHLFFHFSSVTTLPAVFTEWLLIQLIHIYTMFSNQLCGGKVILLLSCFLSLEDWSLFMYRLESIPITK